MLYADELLLAKKLGRSAGKILKHHFNRPYAVYKKNTPHNSLVTDVDLASEKLITQGIRHYFPNDAVISEEEGWSRRNGTRRTWLVDPLDGTWNFVHGKRLCGVMIALTSDEVVQMAVIHNPFVDLLAEGVRGCGVLVNGISIKLANITEVKKIVVDEGANRESVLCRASNCFCLRSTVDNVLAVLQGQAYAYVNNSAKIWDLAPASLLLEEAGLKITNFAGQPFVWQKEAGLIAASPVLHTSVVQQLKVP